MAPTITTNPEEAATIEKRPMTALITWRFSYINNPMKRLKKLINETPEFLGTETGLDSAYNDALDVIREMQFVAEAIKKQQKRMGYQTSPRSK